MLEIEKVSVRYSSDEWALEKIDCSLEEATITGIIGPNGAGKSTLLKAILNILPYSGKIRMKREPTKKWLKKIAYVEQKSAIDFTFPITVKECVSLGTYPEVGLFKRLRKKDWEKTMQALEIVKMERFSNRQISELSGGQFQRVLLARCLVQNSEVILLDEPFVGIDAISEQIIMQTLEQLKQAGKMILIVHHDLSKVEQYFDQLILLNRRLIAAGPTKSVFQENSLRQAYGENIFIKGGSET
ncbi:metal ABC transporter ATP-binding protein [Listeria kieliensis]|uniref:Manganese ABC transporter ATP-binding protein n=1 Tax=Listeria kieliensis TaxID=1621700 RepID=A0A3D8TVA3_9LIST|nr:metal ABC transporter ATP-binding protein [Listeria kieliensis]RDX02587.1 manganese ABC transporter ATP-binding protein [Listeria kieliensis]